MVVQPLIPPTPWYRTSVEMHEIVEAIVWGGVLVATVWLVWTGVRRRDALGWLFAAVPGIVGAFMASYAGEGALTIWALELVTILTARRSLKTTRREADEQGGSPEPCKSGDSSAGA